uniref:Uncharacterized protein n=1 Tax=Onchocerca volvulus TaxID=6282 RepID=A0A8R1XX73_ONCVO
MYLPHRHLPKFMEFIDSRIMKQMALIVFEPNFGTTYAKTGITIIIFGIPWLQFGASSADSAQSIIVRPMFLSGNDSENIPSPAMTNESPEYTVYDKATNICEAGHHLYAMENHSDTLSSDFSSARRNGVMVDDCIAVVDALPTVMHCLTGAHESDVYLLIELTIHFIESTRNDHSDDIVSSSSRQMSPRIANFRKNYSKHCTVTAATYLPSEQRGIISC